MTAAAWVSVNKTYEPGMTIADLEPWAASAWALGLAKAGHVEQLIAVFKGEAIAVWEVRGAFATDEMYDKDDRAKPRIAFALGASLPVLPQHREVPALRRGIATGEVDVPPVPSRRHSTIEE